MDSNNSETLRSIYGCDKLEMNKICREGTLLTVINYYNGSYLKTWENCCLNVRF